MRLLSNLFFFVASFALFISIILLDLSIRHMRERREIKSKRDEKLGLKFLIWAGLFYLASYLVAIFFSR